MNLEQHTFLLLEYLQSSGNSYSYLSRESSNSCIVSGSYDVPFPELEVNSSSSSSSGSSSTGSFEAPTRGPSAFPEPLLD
jgi:hypothetical protein